MCEALIISQSADIVLRLNASVLKHCNILLSVALLGYVIV